MRSLVIPFALSGLVLGGCAGMAPLAERGELKCGETKNSTFEIGTRKGPHIVGVAFTMACEGDKRGVELKLENHPWGGTVSSRQRVVGKDSPRYEYIPCANTPELKAKWEDLQDLSHYLDMGREIDDARHAEIDMRFDWDYRLRHYTLNTAKNFCDAGQNLTSLKFF